MEKAIKNIVHLNVQIREIWILLSSSMTETKNLNWVFPLPTLSTFCRFCGILFTIYICLKKRSTCGTWLYVVKVSNLTNVILTTSVKDSVPDIVSSHGWYIKPWPHNGIDIWVSKRNSMYSSKSGKTRLVPSQSTVRHSNLVEKCHLEVTLRKKDVSCSLKLHIDLISSIQRLHQETDCVYTPWKPLCKAQTLLNLTYNGS